jgi:GMP synthase (glutamine-hydrolysing)
MKPVIVVQHIQCETPGTIAEVLDARGIPRHAIRVFHGDPVPPQVDEAAGLVIMGGPMGVYEQARYPFLRDEIRLLESALRAEVPVLGVCLGSQLLASALGAKVAPGTRKEIGWHPVWLSQSAGDDPLWKGAQPRFTAFHWHGDVFDLPRGAVSLASSELTACQAFRHGDNAYGLLFHMEVTDQLVSGMVKDCSDELTAAGISGMEILTKRSEHLPQLRSLGQSVFGRWTDLVEHRARDID